MKLTEVMNNYETQSILSQYASKEDIEPLVEALDFDRKRIEKVESTMDDNFRELELRIKRNRDHIEYVLNECRIIRRNTAIWNFILLIVVLYLLAR